MTLLHAAECDPPHAFPFHFSNSQNFGYKKFSNTKAASARHSVRTSVRASRRDAPESLKETSALMGVVTPRGPRKAPRGRAGCRAPDAPAASRAKKAARPRTSIHSGGTGKPGNPARNGVTLYAVLSSGRCSIAPVFLRKMACRTRLGPTNLRRNYPSVRGGTTRLRSPLQYRSSCATFISSQPHLVVRTALPTQITPDTAASIASHPASVTIAKRPSWAKINRRRWRKSIDISVTYRPGLWPMSCQCPVRE